MTVDDGYKRDLKKEKKINVWISDSVIWLFINFILMLIYLFGGGGVRYVSNSWTPYKYHISLFPAFKTLYTSSIYIPLRLRCYEGKGKLNIFELVQRLILFFYF